MSIITNTAEFLNHSTTETGDIAGTREDLSNAIYDISPTETPFVSNIGRTKATNVRHEWQTDVLAAAAANAQIQGNDYTSLDAVVATKRQSNVTQISAKTIIIAGTTEALLKAGRKSELAYQVAKIGKELKRDVEYNLTGVRTGELAAVSDTGGKTRTLENWMSSNASHNGSGATVTTATTTVTDGTQRNLTVNKQNISSQFAGIATLYRDANSGPATIVGASDMYIHDYGELKVVPSRFSRDRTLSILQKDMWAVAYLRPFKIEKLAKTGDAEKRLLLVEYALEARNEAASGKVADLTTTLI